MALSYLLSVGFPIIMEQFRLGVRNKAVSNSGLFITTPFTRYLPTYRYPPIQVPYSLNFYCCWPVLHTTIGSFLTLNYIVFDHHLKESTHQSCRPAAPTQMLVVSGLVGTSRTSWKTLSGA